jgi:DNA (cytosine-5)-methyltransferase 1
MRIKNKIFFNEFESFPAQWIRNYFNEEVTVDERSIHEINPDELDGFQRVHLFAGVSGWEIALRQAEWPTDVPVWSGSCPCQPFSAAGLGKGTADDRHLWPEFLRLVTACRPPHVFGEQVSGRKVTGKLYTPRAWERLEPEARRAAREADAESWFRHVQTDLEGIGYIVGHCVFPACGFGAAHLRQRLYWYARLLDDTESERREVCHTEDKRETHAPINASPDSSNRCTDERGCDARYVADSLSKGLEGYSRYENDGEKPRRHTEKTPRPVAESCPLDGPGPTNGFWGTVDWIFCRDYKWRPVEPGSSPLAYGIPSRASKIRAGLAFLGYGSKALQRVIRKSKEILQKARSSRNGQLSGYGNAIVIPQAVEFIKACMEEL